jgi:predicted  nucleic acid-binding Zn-ribbon protein
MPHQCTDCSRTFADGSKEMLSGCPDCGGNKFQFRPDGVDSSDPDADPPEPPEPAADGVTRAVGSAATAVRDLVSADPAEPEPANSGAGHAGSTPGPADGAPEDAAQASARTDVVPMDDLPDDTDTPADAEGGETARGSEPTTTDEREDRPDLGDLREKLNDQFESIRVLEPGQYELNLMDLYDREEYIIALQEDGKYTIQVPERWKDD